MEFSFNVGGLGLGYDSMGRLFVPEVIRCTFFGMIKVFFLSKKKNKNPKSPNSFDMPFSLVYLSSFKCQAFVGSNKCFKVGVRVGDVVGFRLAGGQSTCKTFRSL